MSSSSGAPPVGTPTCASSAARLTLDVNVADVACKNSGSKGIWQAATARLGTHRNRVGAEDGL